MEQDFRETYNFRTIMSQEKPKKEEGGLIKVPEYVIRFKENYNFRAIISERII